MMAKVGYSPTEKRLLELLPANGRRVSTRQLADQLYKDTVQPWHAGIIVGTGMRSLIRKVTHNREPFRIKKTPRDGPNPIEFWREKVKSSAST